ncbi:hypothetical protein D7033_21745 [Aquimarina sp. AD10]|nr:hypothetical protein D7033_21745 [Aquimarina sp. AD10]
MSNIYGQENNKIYLNRAHNYSTTYSYQVGELILKSDSTFISKSYQTSKKNWRNYKDVKPEIDSGRITRKGKFHILTEYRNGNKTNYTWTVKITDNSIVFFYPNRRGELRKTVRYKRILINK